MHIVSLVYGKTFCGLMCTLTLECIPAWSVSFLNTDSQPLLWLEGLPFRLVHYSAKNLHQI